MTTVRSAALVLLLGPALYAAAQSEVPCLNNDPALFSQLHGNDPELLTRIAQEEAELEAHTTQFVQHYSPGEREPYIISVVFHVIHANGVENILDEQLHDAIRILNEDFNKLNPDWANVRPDFLDRVADVGIEFRLARKDPDGNCTNGITRTYSPLTAQGDYQMTSLIHWPRDRYMNVWVAASANGAAGYTNYPSALHNFPLQDGIVVMHTYVGSIGTSTPYTSRVLTHEVGHWLNLRHAWGNSNNPGIPSNCNQDDLVEDTPNTMGWTSCYLAGTTCDESLDNVENYMEYSYCCKMFTEGQKARMLAALNSSTAERNQLWQPGTLALTGVLEEDNLCSASFYTGRRTICAGESIQLFDQSFNGVVARQWELPGAEPAISTEAHPTVIYPTPGVYPVTLKVSNGTDTLTAHEATYITVLPDPGVPTPFQEGFETGPIDGMWMVGNPDGDNTWHLTDAASYSGSHSVRILNTAAMDGRRDELVSHPVDMTGTAPIRLSFRYAYARRNNSSDDRLRVYVSHNCGVTWSMRKQLRGQMELNTAGAPQGGTFVPGPDQWQECVITTIGTMFQTSGFRLKFEFESDGGNAIYIDDINLGTDSPTGIIESATTEGGALTVVPNPAADQAQAWLTLARGGELRLELLDVAGRRVADLFHGTLAGGTHRFDLPLADVPAGAYFVKATTATGVEVVRLVRE